MIEKKKKYKLSDFRYQLPKKYIAQKPAQKRENSKMMVLNREDRTITHKKFVNIVDYFQKNDLLYFKTNFGMVCKHCFHVLLWSLVTSHDFMTSSSFHLTS